MPPDIKANIEALARAIANDNEAEGIKAITGLVGGALTDLRRIADALETLAKPPITA